MSGLKTFINKTNQDVSITLLIRQSTHIQLPSTEQSFSLHAGESKVVTYGNDSDIFLNGLVFQWKNAQTQSMNTNKQEIFATGIAPTFDWVLNTHSKITINTLDGLNISASN
jgi:hypothetical protein